MKRFGVLKFVVVIAVLLLVTGAVSIASAQDGYEPMDLVVSCEIGTGNYFWRLILHDLRSPDWKDVVGEWTGAVDPYAGILWTVKDILMLAGDNARYLRGDLIQLNGWSVPNSDVGYAEILVLDDNRVIYSEYVEMAAYELPAICGEPITA